MTTGDKVIMGIFLFTIKWEGRHASTNNLLSKAWLQQFLKEGQFSFGITAIRLNHNHNTQLNLMGYVLQICQFWNDQEGLDFFGWIKRGEYEIEFNMVSWLLLF